MFSFRFSSLFGPGHSKLEVVGLVRKHYKYVSSAWNPGDIQLLNTALSIFLNLSPSLCRKIPSGSVGWPSNLVIKISAPEHIKCYITQTYRSYVHCLFHFKILCDIWSEISDISSKRLSFIYRSCRKLRALYRISECQKELRLDSDVKCHQIAQNGEEVVLLMTNLSRKTENPTIVSGAIPV